MSHVNNRVQVWGVQGRCVHHPSPVWLRREQNRQHRDEHCFCDACKLQRYKLHVAIQNMTIYDFWGHKFTCLSKKMHVETFVLLILEKHIKTVRFSIAIHLYKSADEWVTPTHTYTHTGVCTHTQTHTCAHTPSYRMLCCEMWVSNEKEEEEIGGKR